ncbi:MAG: hypothetical protein EPN99_06150 [Frankiales bacterium]|nr:MAG: hypothetical protein EPN99_06150 [Frankiales bacterium]
MEHVVFFPAPDGTPAFRRVPSLEEAVRLVEHLRNVDGVASASVHALTEVPLAFRAYYKVEVPAEASVPAQQVAEPVGLEPIVVEPEHEVAEVVETPALALVEDVQPDGEQDEELLAASNGHSQAAPASLGFFA